MTLGPGRAPVTDTLLAEGRLTPLGRLSGASNATLLCLLGDDDPERAPRAVYKPVAGERPLVDFPDGTLAAREVAAFRLAGHMPAADGTVLVPPTLLRDGPLGPGMVQAWVEDLHADEDLVDLVPLTQVPDGWHRVLAGTGEDGRAVALVHADDAALRRLALFDLVANNADRKAGHLLPGPHGLRGVDHGLTFHPEPKLRTVLWGWAGAALDAAELDLLERLGADLPAAAWPAELLAPEEVDALLTRVHDLRAGGVWPLPDAERTVVPWPLW